MKWRDRTSYSHNDKERAPGVLDVEVEHITITVYRHIEYGQRLDWSVEE